MFALEFFLLLDLKMPIGRSHENFKLLFYFLLLTMPNRMVKISKSVTNNSKTGDQIRWFVEVAGRTCRPGEFPPAPPPRPASQATKARWSVAEPSNS